MDEDEKQLSFEIRDAETNEVVHAGTMVWGPLSLPDWLPKDRAYDISMDVGPPDDWPPIIWELPETGHDDG